VGVPYQAVRRYEELLGLSAGVLTATAATVHCYYCVNPGCRGPCHGVAREGDTATIERAEHLIDLACSTDVMTGQNWEELTSIIAATPRFLIAPSRTWALLAERLLYEQIIADGVPWMQRYTAMSRLLAHPVAQRAAIATCASLAADPANQVGVEVICALDATNHPDAGRHVLAQLADPANSMVFYGALLACVRKLTRGHYTPEQMASLVPLATQVLEDSGHHDDSPVLAANLLHHIHQAFPAWPVPQIPAPLTSLAASGPDQDANWPRPNGDTRIRRIVCTAAAQMPREAPWPYDQMLAAVVDEILNSPISDVSLHAAIMIRATPYRAPVATALAAELRTALTAPHVELATRILDAFRIIGGKHQRRIVEQLTLSQGLPAAITAAAARNIGHLDGTSADQYWTQTIQTHSQRQHHHPTPAGRATVRGLVYGLGIAGNGTLLTRIQNSRTALPQARQAATWWLGHPHYIQQSATR
jgi:hypothetical protein